MSNLTGKTFGRYQILERLGQGGLAVVRQHDVVPGLAQRHGAEVADLGLIVDDEDARHGISLPFPCEW
jgi:hypothetical protein